MHLFILIMITTSNSSSSSRSNTLKICCWLAYTHNTPECDVDQNQNLII